ncbi:MAG: TPR end-of-group domain-containing protein [Candidatus Acidiferrales bacterium]
MKRSTNAVGTIITDRRHRVVRAHAGAADCCSCIYMYCDSSDSIVYNVACAYARVGRTEDAIACLQRIMEHGDFLKNWAAKDSDLDSLRSDPGSRPSSASAVSRKFLR